MHVSANQPTTRACQVCWREFTPSRANNIYCTIRCKNTAFNRRRRPQITDTTTGINHQPTNSAPQPQTTTIRNCPHCSQPITIVALLTTPHAARPSTPTDTVIPLHRN
jgi:hypothetical protein